LDVPREDFVQGAVAREPGIILENNTPYQVRFTFFGNMYLYESEVGLQPLG